MARSARQHRAVVAGGSVGGLFIGNMLARQGWQVDIFERVSEGLEARGAGIAGHDELTAILLENNIAKERPVGIDVSGLDISKERIQELLKVDVEGWLHEIPMIREYYKKFADHLPKELETQLDKLQKRLEAAR